MKKTPPLTIRHARIIDGVAAHASLARTGERLNVSQSSLSRAVAEAEQALGHTLFQRGWTGMEPTSHGEVVIAHCRRMIARIEEAQERLSARGGKVRNLAHHLGWDMLAAADAVRTAGSVSAAASYLGQSQPNVSRAIARLSSAVGRQLFHRTRTGMEGNDDVGLLCALYKSLMQDVLALPTRLAVMTGEVTGRISIGLLPFSEQAMVMQAFGAMLRRYRHVRLQAVTGGFPPPVGGRPQNQTDVVLRRPRQPAPYDALEETPLLRESYAMVTRADHPLAKGRPTLEQLARENWIVAPHGTPTRRYFEELLIRHGLTPPAQTCEIVTFSLAEQMILSSDAIGLLTYSKRKRASLRKDLKILPVDLLDSEREIGLTFRKNQPLTVVQTKFIEILMEAEPNGSTGQIPIQQGVFRDPHRLRARPPDT